MALAATIDGMSYEKTKVRMPKKEGIRVISEMSSHRIIGFLLYRHRVGLLLIGNMLFVSYYFWDKVGRIFF